MIPGYVRVDGGPCDGRLVAIDDLRLFLHRPDAFGYIVSEPTWQHEGQTHYQEPRIDYCAGLARMRRDYETGVAAEEVTRRREAGYYDDGEEWQHASG